MIRKTISYTDYAALIGYAFVYILIGVVHY